MTFRSALALAALATSSVAGVGPLGAQVPQELSVEVDSIVVLGNERNSDTWVVDRSGLRVGVVVHYPQVQNAIRRLFATGEFSDVKIWVTPQVPAVFYIEVVERPTITEYRFQGLESVNPSSIRDSVGLVRNGPLDPFKIARARVLIEEKLGSEGFPQARVDTAVVPDPFIPTAYQVVFRVAEGPRLGVTKISFEGNEAFSDGALRGAMRTGEEGFFWWQAGGLKREEYRQDLSERLPAFYSRYGYLDFAVVDDTIVVDPSTGKGRIVIRVDEGPQYLLEDFHVQGNRRFPTATLRELFDAELGEIEEGEHPPFNQVAFEEAQGKLEDLYRNAGYLRAFVVPDVERLPPDSSGGHPRVAASWLVREGTPTYVREVRIVGNTYTHDRIIRSRLFIFPGDIYAQQRLVSSVQGIQGLGFFTPLPPQEAVDIRQRDDGDVDVTLRVKEKQTGTVNFGLSASAATGLAGFIGYQQPNLFGQAKTGSVRWLFGGRQQDIELSYSDPEIFGSKQSLTVSLRNSRDRFINFSLGDRRQIGGLLEVGTPLFGLRATRVFLGYSIFRDKVRDLDTTFVTPTQRQLITQGTRSTLSARIVRDSRNSPLFPTRGNRNSFSARFTGGVLGGSGDYAKMEFESQWFLPVAQVGGGLQSLPIEVTAGLSFRGGAILGDNPFFLERFFMGGTNVGVQLRGYKEATITPQGHVPRNARFSQLDRVGESYFSTTALLGSKLTNSLFLSTFLDAGNVWARPEELNPSDLLVGAGVGMSLVTPFGPLGLDYAYGFDRRDVLGRPDPGWTLHFKFGRVF
ncbi:MAG: outer membrane protein assembly factor BamA [Gemmatimonadota bacterium]